MRRGENTSYMLCHSCLSRKRIPIKFYFFEDLTTEEAFLFLELDKVAKCCSNPYYLPDWFKEQKRHLLKLTKEEKRVLVEYLL